LKSDSIGLEIGIEMGVLGNLDHERFCQSAHKRIWAGEQRKEALTAAYRDTIYSGDDPESPSIADNARRLANTKTVKGRLGELADYSAKLAGIDASWALLRLKDYTDFNVHDYLSAPNELGQRFFDVGRVPKEKLARLVELQQEEFIEGRGEAAQAVRKTKIKGHDPISALALMARIAGWEAPKKIAPTDAEGKTLTRFVVEGAPVDVPSP
jgi:hypothetical protein